MYFQFERFPSLTGVLAVMIWNETSKAFTAVNGLRLLIRLVPSPERLVESVAKCYPTRSQHAEIPFVHGYHVVARLVPSALDLTK